MTHHGLCASLRAQKSVYAMYWGKTSPAATSNPPIPKHTVRTNLETARFPGMLTNVQTNSKRNNTPFSKPLALTVHEAESAIALSRARKLPCKCLPALTASKEHQKMRVPVKTRNENRLSLYGADKKRPAGERM